MTFYSEPREGTPPLTSTVADGRKAVAALAKGHGPFAIDTERAATFRYSSRAYLIQIKREGAGLFLLDAPALGEVMDELADVLATDMWILHAVDQDLPCLHMDGLEAPKVFDTQVAAQLLGREHVSLQAVLQSELGIDIAKDQANSDWSKRPLEKSLLSYAALDVEFLIELERELTAKVEEAGRMRWLEEECEHLRLSPDPEPRPDPWRRSAKREKIDDRRALGMAKELWEVRDEVAKDADLAPLKIIRDNDLAHLAATKPRSAADVKNRVRGRAGRYTREFWQAIDTAWHLDERELPSAKPVESRPRPQRWERINPDAAERWNIVRPAVLARAEELGIRQEVLMRPAHQQTLAWQGWSSVVDATEKLLEAGARPWQIEEVLTQLPRSSN